MLFSRHHSWKPDHVDLPSHLVLAVFHSLHSCLKPSTDFSRSMSTFFSFTAFILQLQRHAAPAQTTWEVVSGECETHLAVAGLGLMGSWHLAETQWERSSGRGARPPRSSLSLSQLHSILCQLKWKLRVLQMNKIILDTKEKKQQLVIPCIYYYLLS